MLFPGCHRQDTELYRSLRNILGFRPRHLELYQLALRHKSQSLQREDGVLLNNERLEFLGDAVLDSLVADILFRHFDLEGEGFLTDTRSKIVKRESLNNLSLELGLDRLLLTSARTASPRQSIFGNMLEALIAAIYLDGGSEAAADFIRRFVLQNAQEHIRSRSTDNKTALQELIQQQPGSSIRYELVGEDGPDHDKRFFYRVHVNGVPAGEGSGRTKKEAEQAAAGDALQALAEEPGPDGGGQKAP